MLCLTSVTGVLAVSTTNALLLPPPTKPPTSQTLHRSNGLKVRVRQNRSPSARDYNSQVASPFL